MVLGEPPVRSAPGNAGDGHGLILRAAEASFGSAQGAPARNREVAGIGRQRGGRRGKLRCQIAVSCWCGPGCRHWAWQQHRAAASGLVAREVVEQVVTVEVPARFQGTESGN